MKQARVKKRFVIGLLLITFILGLQSFVIGQVYQWTDEEGIVQMTDDPKHIPEKYRDRVNEVTLPNEREKPADRPKADGPAPFTPAERTDDQGHNRDWWQARVKEWRLKKTAAEQELAHANGQLAQARMAPPSIARRQAEIEAQEEIKRRQEEVQQAERILGEQLPEEARKANALPGWLREISE